MVLMQDAPEGKKKVLDCGTREISAIHKLQTTQKYEIVQQKASASWTI
jgi:hypothetical protein